MDWIQTPNHRAERQVVKYQTCYPLCHFSLNTGCKILFVLEAYYKHIEVQASTKADVLKLVIKRRPGGIRKCTVNPTTCMTCN